MAEEQPQASSQYCDYPIEARGHSPDCPNAGGEDSTRMEQPGEDVENREKIARLQALFQEGKKGRWLKLSDEELARVNTLIKSGDYYNEKIDSEKRFSMPVHKWMFYQTPGGPNEYPQGKYPEHGKKITEMMKLIEEVSPPTLEQFFSGEEIATEVQDTISVNDEVNAVIHIKRRNENEVWKTYGREDLSKEAYRVDISLTDETGKVIHRFNDDLEPGSYIAATRKWSSAKDRVELNTSDPNVIKTFATEGLIALAHEIGHNKQLNDTGFRERFRAKKGCYPEEGKSSEPILERDAEARGLRLLKEIERGSGKRVLPDFETVHRISQQGLKTYGAEKSPDDEARGDRPSQ